MRALLIFLYLITSTYQIEAQIKICGIYRDYFGCQFEIYPDSTFRYTFGFDTESSWSKGKWKIKNDTVYFTTILVFDTIKYIDPKTNLAADSLFLSIDEKSNLGFDSVYIMRNREKVYIPVYNLKTQNTHPAIDKLYYRKNKLYEITPDGKLKSKKVKGFWTQKKVPSWFVKMNPKNVKVT